MGSLLPLTLNDISKGHREKVSAAYTMTHLKSGMIYIGSSSHIVKRHFRHKLDLKNSAHQNKTLQELYNDCPEFEFFYFLARDREHAMEIEQRLIDQHRPSGKLINKFLDVKSPNKGGTLSEEFKQHLRELNTGKTLSDDAKRKISEALRGRAFSDERKARLRIALKGIKKTMANRDEFVKDRQARFGKPVMIDGVTYPGLGAAAREFSVSITCVKHRIRSKNFPSWTFI